MGGLLSFLGVMFILKLVFNSGNKVVVVREQRGPRFDDDLTKPGAIDYLEYWKPNDK